MVFCGESIITEISVYVSFYMSEFIIQSTLEKFTKKKLAIILHLVYYNKCAHEVSTSTTNMDH